MARSNRRGGSRTDRFIDPAQRPTRVGQAILMWLGVLVGLGAVSGGADKLWDWVQPDPVPFADYITSNPDVPPKANSTSMTIVGIQDGMYIDEVEKMMPEDADYFPTPSEPPGTTHAQWRWRGLYVNLDIDDESGETSGLLITRDEPSPVYASLPGGLLLGHSTLADIANSLGHPDEIRSTFEEGDVDDSLVYYPETDDRSIIVLSGVNSQTRRGQNPETPLSEANCGDTPYRIEVVPLGQHHRYAEAFDATPKKAGFCGVPMREDQVDRE